MLFNIHARAAQEKHVFFSFCQTFENWNCCKRSTKRWYGYSCRL